MYMRVVIKQRCTMVSTVAAIKLFGAFLMG